MKNRKSEAGLVLVLVLIIFLLFFGWLIRIGARECKSNNECKQSEYCGSDFSCHTYPTITVVQYNFIGPSIIIGIAIILASIIFKSLKSFPREESKQLVKKEITATSVQQEVGGQDESYYTSNVEAKNR